MFKMCTHYVEKVNFGNYADLVKIIFVDLFICGGGGNFSSENNSKEQKNKNLLYCYSVV